MCRAEGLDLEANLQLSIERNIGEPVISNYLLNDDLLLLEEAESSDAFFSRKRETALPPLLDDDSDNLINNKYLGRSPAKITPLKQ